MEEVTLYDAGNIRSFDIASSVLEQCEELFCVTLWNVFVVSSD